MENIFKQTIKKIAKAKFFREITYSNDAISFKHFGRVFSLQKIDGEYFYASGYVHTAKVLKPTFKSEYNQLGLVEVASFQCDYRQRTDNPDFVLRQSLYLIGLENLN